MSPKRIPISPYQDTIFSLEKPAPESLSLPGVSVSIKERAEQLLYTLDSIGAYRKLGGLAIITSYSSDKSRIIEGRYKDGTDRVLEFSSEKEKREYSNSKKHFAEAFGLKDMLAHDEIVNYDPLKDFRNEFENFTEHNFGPKIATSRRGKLRRTLSKQLKKSV
jgi:hypothetical protein